MTVTDRDPLRVGSPDYMGKPGSDADRRPLPLPGREGGGHSGSRPTGRHCTARSHSLWAAAADGLSRVASDFSPQARSCRFPTFCPPRRQSH